MSNKLFYLGIAFFSGIFLEFISRFCNVETDALQYCLFILVLILFCFFRFQQNCECQGYWYKPSNIFILAYVIVNYQYIIDLVIGYKTYGNFFYPETVNDCTIVATYGIIAFFVGYIIKKPKLQTPEINCKEMIDTKLISVLHILMLIMWCLTVDIVSIASGLTYSGNDTSSNNFELLFYQTTITLMVTTIYNLKFEKKVSLKSFFRQVSLANWFCILIYCIIRMASGDRGPFIYTILSVFFAFIISSKIKIKPYRLFLSIILLALVVNLIGIARSFSHDQSFSERMNIAFSEFTSGGDARFSEKTISTLTEELGLSIRCNQIAINKIKYQGYPMHNGGYFFFEILQCIPFVPSFLANTLHISEYDLSANYLMTDDYVGRHDLFQIGTTIISVPYFDFGLIGVILMLMLTGLVFKYVDYGVCVCTPKNIIQIIIILLFASMALYIPRSTLIIQLKNLIPVVVLFYINYKASFFIKKW